MGGSSLIAALLTGFFWDNPIFSNDTWSWLMNGLRIALPLGGAMWLFYEAWARRLGKSVAERTQKLVLVGMTLLACGAYFDFFNPNTRYPEYYHRHEFYHHYLGAKYSRQLGYTRLYTCTAIAEIELGRNAEVRTAELRDLRDNQIKPVSATYVLTDPAQCKRHFSSDAWKAFKHDVDFLWSVSRGSYWENMRKDHGFNDSPVWIVTGKLFASFGPASDASFKLLCAIDVWLLAGVVVLVIWAFGWRVGAIAAVFLGCNAVSNFYWMGGAFLRQDWLFLLVASLCLARKRRPFLAGAALTWSALLRVFPLVFFLGWAILIALHVVRRLRERRAMTGASRERGLLALLHPDHRRLIGGSIVAVSLLVPASVVMTGPDSYREFFSRLVVVRNTPLTNDVGLETVLVHDWDGRMRFARDDSLDDPFQGWKDGLLARRHRLRFVHYGIVALIFGWTVWALRRTRLLWIGQALVAPLAMSVLNMPNYFFSFFVVCAVLAKVRPLLGPVVLTAAGASQILLLSFYWVDDKFAAQAWLFWIFALCVLWAMSRPVAWSALRAPQRSDSS